MPGSFLAAVILHDSQNCGCYRRIICVCARGNFPSGQDKSRKSVFFFLIGIVEGGVQVVPLGTAAINRPIVPAPGDHDDGRNWWNDDWEGKPKYLEKPEYFGFPCQSSFHQLLHNHHHLSSRGLYNRPVVAAVNQETQSHPTKDNNNNLVTRCSPVLHRRFGWKFRDMLCQQQRFMFVAYVLRFLVCLLFYHEDEYGMLLRNVCELQNYTACHTRKIYFLNGRGICAVTVRPPFLSLRATVKSRATFAGVHGKAVTKLT
jgi:hypothetical protein